MHWTLINSDSKPDPVKDDGSTIGTDTYALHIAGVGCMIRIETCYRSKSGAVSAASSSVAWAPRAVLHQGMVKG